MKDSKFSTIISDADILIDYLESDKRIFIKVSEGICDSYISLPTLREIKQLTKSDAEKLGFKIFEPTLPQLQEASIRGGPLSFEDKICFAVARDNQWTCITNDKNLRKKCTEENVKIAWGLDLMLWLNQARSLSKTDAQNIAKKIKNDNPYIKIEIISEFIEKLK